MHRRCCENACRSPHATIYDAVYRVYRPIIAKPHSTRYSSYKALNTWNILNKMIECVTLSA